MDSKDVILASKELVSNNDLVLMQNINVYDNGLVAIDYTVIKSRCSCGKGNHITLYDAYDLIKNVKTHAIIDHNGDVVFRTITTKMASKAVKVISDRIKSLEGADKYEGFINNPNYGFDVREEE